ncbi:MAG TPA: MarR family transcriptional regulator [Rudaea sp.]|nr:MarR family transcriptional regulator [Rudaea sp.]
MTKPSQEPAPATTELAERLHSAAVHLVRRVRREDAAMGLPPAQASALSVLVFGGARTLSALAQTEQVKAPTMTRIVDALERAGLARRQADARDRRKLSIAATAAGVRVMQQGRARRVKALARLLSSLGRSQRATLNAAVAVLARLQASRSGQ